MRTDYDQRQGRPLPDGSGSGQYFRLVEVLGCHFWIDEDDLTVEGDPTGGTFKLRYEGKTTSALNWDASAASIETALNAILADLDLEVECSGGPLPADPVTITGDNFSASRLKILYGKITGGDLLSNQTWSGSDPVYCSVLDKNGQTTFEAIEATPLNDLYARGIRTLAVKMTDNYLLQGCGGTWYAQVTAMVDYATEGLQIQFSNGGPSGVHKPFNDSDEDDSAWSDGDELYASPFAGTWHVLLRNCPEA